MVFVEHINVDDVEVKVDCLKMAEAYDVVVVGSCMRDLTSYVERLPKAGETVVGHKFVAGFGGKGANQCLAAARLDAKTAMVANLGNDSYGAEYLDTFKAHKVNAEFVSQTAASHTGIASIFVSDNGENCIVIVPGANLLLTPEHVKQSEEVIRNSRVLICQLEANIEATLAALKVAKHSGVKTIFNAAPARRDIPDEFYPLCDIFCVNETEAECVSGLSVTNSDEAKIAAKMLISKGVKTVIVTLGEKGAVFINADQSEGSIPAKKVQAVDTTGAGDAFVGSLAYYLAVHPSFSLATAIERACEYASISVQYPGTHVSFPWKKDLPTKMFQ